MSSLMPIIWECKNARRSPHQWHISAKRGAIRSMHEGVLKQIKAQVRARVEHPLSYPQKSP